MKHIKTILLAGSVAFLLSACGGGSSSGDSSTSAPVPAPTIDNSGNLENQYGYFGDNVIFGNRNIVGDWSFYQKEYDNYIYMAFYDDGSAWINNNPADYGVNRDGTLLRTTSGDIILNSIMYDYYNVTDKDGKEYVYDCYNIDATEDGTTYTGIVMCPEHYYPPQSYKTLSDLEFNTLNFTEYWHVIDSYQNSTMEFANNYISDSDDRPILVDILSDADMASGCGIAPVESGMTYMCIRAFSSGAAAAYLLDIDSTGNITGNYEFSLTGDSNELAEGLLYRDLADAWVTGTVSSAVATAQTKVINTEIYNQAKLAEFDSIIPQPLKKQSNKNSETAQMLDEMFNQLMLKDEL